MSMMTSAEPFRVMNCTLLVLATGRSAQNLREFWHHLAGVDPHSLRHHFYDSLLRPAFDHPEFLNDFAHWARRDLHDPLLAERLGAVDPIDFPDDEALRQHLLDVVEDRLAEVSEVPQSARGKEFHFLRSQFLIIDTGMRARTPAELGSMIPKMSTGSIFYHVVEARNRAPFRMDDFAAWLGPYGTETLEVRERLAKVDCRLWSLTELRDRVGKCFHVRLPGEGATP